MKRTVAFFLIVVWVGSMGAALFAAEPGALKFGFGGAMAMAFFPDMTGINTFMSENGLPPMGDVLIGVGGGGRGGVIGGPAFGGVGWGVLAASKSEDRSAELVFGGAASISAPPSAGTRARCSRWGSSSAAAPMCSR